MKQGNHGNSQGEHGGGEGVDRKLHNPIEDRLIPLEPLDLQKVTSIDSLDNVRHIVGNGKIFGDVIQNYSTNAYRRVDLTAQLAHGVDVHAAMALLKKALAGIPNVMTNPAPDVEILTFNLAGPVLAVRPYCNNKDYWQVYFDTNRLIKETFTTAGFEVPEQHYMVRTAGAGFGAAHSA